MLEYVNEGGCFLMGDAYPNFFIKRKRLSKTKTIIIVRHNNLTVDMFKQVGDAFVFEKLHTKTGVSCYLKITVRSDTVDDLFKLDSTTFKVAGTKNHFGIYICIPDGKLPRKNQNTIGRVSYELVITGNNNAIFYDNPKRKPPRKRSVIESSRTPIDIPDSVRWAISHPYQGGKTSPK